MKGFALRITAAFFISVNVFCLLWFCQPPAPAKTTLGRVAEKSSDFSGQRVIISNAILGERNGRYIRFKSSVDYRHDVVFALAAEVEPGCTTFRAYVFGVMDERIPGCPHDPPFLYVMDVRPAKDSASGR